MLNSVYEIDRNSFKPLYVQLSEIILNNAVDNQIEHGDTLPSENELLAQFDVSRNTIRQAVERLVKMGVAKKTRGQGTFYQKEKKALAIDYPHAFEGSVARLGLKVTNKLINLETVSGQVQWIKYLGKTNWDETIWIRRLKFNGEELLAVEERLLPGYVVKRYTQENIESENISPNLMDQYPDTQTNRFNYMFVSHPLSEEESLVTHLSQGVNCLRRIGEYYNSVDDRFMLSRLTVISSRINLGYEYIKHENNWIMKD